MGTYTGRTSFFTHHFVGATRGALWCREFN